MTEHHGRGTHMARPSAIVWFERLYLASIGIYVANALVFWSENRALMETVPQVRAAPALTGLIGPIAIATLAITVLGSLLFWFLVVRRRSAAGKWLVVVTEVVGVLAAVPAILALARGTAPNPPGVALSLLATGLAVAAAAMLVRSDAAAWFSPGDSSVAGA